jgi:hypothetical protein
MGLRSLSPVFDRQCVNAMLEWWKDIFRPIRVTDPQFGSLRFLRHSAFWEARAQFHPIDGTVEVLIHGSPTGPTDEQRAFFEMVERRYQEIWPAVRVKLLEEAKWVDSDDEEFKLVCVDVPESPASAAEWQLSYEGPSRCWYFTVTMRDWQPQHVHAEC